MGFDNVNVNVGGPVQPTSTYKTKVLKGNHSFASQVTEPNTKYVIKHDFVLDGDVTIPANCVLEFDGGSISNGVLTGQNTVIGEDDKVRIFGDDLSLAGTWNVKEGYPEWFGCVPDDNTIDTTPAIQKFVAVAIPVVFGDGTWYLSECLLQGNKNVNIKGTGNSYKVGTIFKAFNATGQRFIMKLGGLADFGKPSDYYEVWCSNFILDGIRFTTYDTTLNNEEPPYEGQCYAAVCFDFCVQGYVNIWHGGVCPGVFIANTWEVYFENIVCYGSATKLNESAVYFGKAYTDVVASNISAVTIENLFGETIYGKFVDCHNNANINDLIINNIEFEPYYGDPSEISHSGADAYSIIESNIRDMNILYYLNFTGGQVVIQSIVGAVGAVTYQNDSIARGFLRAGNYGCNMTVDTITNNGFNNLVNIFGAAGYARLTIDKFECEGYTGNTCVYTDTGVVSDFSNIAGQLPNYTGTVIIRNCKTVSDYVDIKVYNPGLIFNRDNVGEVTSLKASNYNSLQFVGKVGDSNIPMVYFNGITLKRKFKFNGKVLTFRHGAVNPWSSANIIITYYKDDSSVHIDNIKLEYSETKIITYKYSIYSGKYDYCIIQFPSAVCLESLVLDEVNEKIEQTVVYGSKISSEVIEIMSHYVRDDIYKRTALQYFFDTIGDVKNKLNHLILPIFSNNLDEALYDVINDAPFYNIDGGNYLEFNKTTRRLHMSVLVGGSITWRDVNYQMYDPVSFQGGLIITSTTKPVGGASADFTGLMMYGFDVHLDLASVGFFAPNATGNSKIIGCGIVNSDGQRKYMRLGDTDNSDKLTVVGDELYPGWDYRFQVFGQKPDNDTKGVRILVSTDQLLTDEEAKLLRDAVITLDNKYSELDAVNDNYTPAMEAAIIPKSGTFDNRPTIADYVIPVGFAYFCTDKQTEEGAADGIMIYYKGQDTTDPDNPVDIWVDALGRVVS